MGTPAVRDQRAGRPRRHFTAVFGPAFKQGVQERRAARVGQQLPAQADQAARRNREFHAHPSGAVVDHFAEFAAPASQRLHHHANKVFRTIHHQSLEGFKFLAVFLAHHDFRLADHQFVTLAAHGFNQDGELQFAARKHAKHIGGFRIDDAQGNVGEQFFLQARAEIARSDPLALAAGKGARY